MRDVTAREAFHTVLLREMVARLKQGAFVLKGGVNLRLFFGNVRYSQDIDFDLDPSARQPLSQLLRQLLADREFGLRLKELGIRGVHYGGRPHKDSTATLRFKLGIEIPGGIVLPTRIEASLRDRPEAEDVVVDTADERVVREYLRESDGPLLIPHYHWMPSIRQKIAALGLRSTVRARDVFDLHVLAHGRISARSTLEPCAVQPRHRCCRQLTHEHSRSATRNSLIRYSPFSTRRIVSSTKTKIRGSGFSYSSLNYSIPL